MPHAKARSPNDALGSCGAGSAAAAMLVAVQYGTCGGLQPAEGVFDSRPSRQGQNRQKQGLPMHSRGKKKHRLRWHLCSLCELAVVWYTALHLSRALPRLRSRLGAGLAEPPITSSIPPSPTCPTAANVAALTAPTGAGGAAGGSPGAARNPGHTAAGTADGGRVRRAAQRNHQAPAVSEGPDSQPLRPAAAGSCGAEAGRGGGGGGRGRAPAAEAAGA